ncbi:nucleoside phosphorylase domain-containing protein [Leptodontidium sp. 2 PMI_412]|nr:nucleoside phosphorylase domain-containing protein [Leptodontidium sp. 2 PMI_412]
MAARPRNHRNQYTVGWICALYIEQTAATAMLDFKHPALPNPRNDSNSYTLGSVGEHNVVIACLPIGQISNNQAAVVASQMLTTFPSIKFGLMVGIGAGIPPQVQLGDVVVSSPRDQYSGVVQWDFGKERQNDTFKWTEHVNNPPSILLTAVTRLSTELAIKGPRYVDQLIDKSSKLPAEYRKSDSLKDILFNADCENCGMGQAKEREPRDICVHYDLIASGNKVVKDVTTRDSLNRSFDRKVLCIEMEAAGVMTSCPCIVVIRGICDYADSHKNKAWQEHAAAVAAVYARELLKNVSPSAVEEEPPAKETIRQGGVILQLLVLSFHYSFPE